MTSHVPCSPAMDFSFASAGVKTFYATTELGISGPEQAGFHFNFETVGLRVIVEMHTWTAKAV